MVTCAFPIILVYNLVMQNADTGILFRLNRIQGCVLISIFSHPGQGVLNSSLNSGCAPIVTTAEMGGGHEDGRRHKQRWDRYVAQSGTYKNNSSLCDLPGPNEKLVQEHRM